MDEKRRLEAQQVKVFSVGLLLRTWSRLSEACRTRSWVHPGLVPGPRSDPVCGRAVMEEDIRFWKPLVGVVKTTRVHRSGSWLTPPWWGKVLLRSELGWRRYWINRSGPHLITQLGSKAPSSKEASSRAASPSYLRETRTSDLV